MNSSAQPPVDRFSDAMLPKAVRHGGGERVRVNRTRKPPVQTLTLEQWLDLPTRERWMHADPKGKP